MQWIFFLEKFTLLEKIYTAIGSIGSDKYHLWCRCMKICAYTDYVNIQKIQRYGYIENKSLWKYVWNPVRTPRNQEMHQNIHIQETLRGEKVVFSTHFEINNRNSEIQCPSNKFLLNTNNQKQGCSFCAQTWTFKLN